LEGSRDVSEGHQTERKCAGYQEFKNKHMLIIILLPNSINSSPRNFERADGMVNNAATIHNAQTAATISHHVGHEERWTWKGFTVTLLSTAAEYADRPTAKWKELTHKVAI
jgi:hypothetical protein